MYIYVCVCVRVQRHLSKILNFQSDFDVEGLSTVHQSPTESEMTEMPLKKEVNYAVGKLRNWKVGGESGILLEMANAACCEERVVGPDE